MRHPNPPTEMKQMRVKTRRVKHEVADGPRGICDRCGFDYPLQELRKEWTGFMVCDKDFDVRHPQLDLRVAPDNWGVKNARPRNVGSVRDVGFVRKEDLFRE